MHKQYIKPSFIKQHNNTANQKVEKINSEKKHNNNTVAKDYEQIREFVLEHPTNGVKPTKISTGPNT